MSEALQTAIARQRILLQARLSDALSRLVSPCCEAWGDRRALEQRLSAAMERLPFCKYLYLLDDQARQITANIAREGTLTEHYGRDRTLRPYMAEAVAGSNFSLSSAYLSRNNRRPSLTAVKRLIRSDGVLLGYLGADFDLRDLPLTRELYRQSDQWLQLKGDPAIRGALFYQQRVDSLMDSRIEAILDLVIELMSAHGVFHGKLHFSSSRATLWLLDDPYHFRVLDFEDLNDPAICLAYPQRAYPEDAAIPSARIREIFNQFRELRLMDENIYLRSGSLNIMNGLVALNFSCDGSHYMRWDEFLDKRMDFWLGSSALTESESESETETET
jgi:hypothetical protein